MKQDILQLHGPKKGSIEPRIPSKSSIHLFNDVAGLIPAYGMFFDGLNVVLYTAEGDGINAAASAAAFIPVLGQGATAVKYLVWKVATASGGSTQLVWKLSADGFVSFTGGYNRNNFRSTCPPHNTMEERRRAPIDTKTCTEWGVSYELET